MSPFSQIPPENVTNGQLYAAIMAIASKQALQAEELARLREGFENHRKEYIEYRKDHKHMVDAWLAARGTVRFLKFLAYIGVPLGTVFAFLNGMFNNVLGKGPT